MISTYIILVLQNKKETFYLAFLLSSSRMVPKPSFRWLKYLGWLIKTTKILWNKNTTHSCNVFLLDSKFFIFPSKEARTLQIKCHRGSCIVGPFGQVVTMWSQMVYYMTLVTYRAKQVVLVAIYRNEKMVLPVLKHGSNWSAHQRLLDNDDLLMISTFPISILFFWWTLKSKTTAKWSNKILLTVYITT